MSKSDLGISRRKLLTGLGTIGAAGALGGASTMAFFSDKEEFANNSLVAGELDLKIDWEEHYSDWKGAETEYASMPTDGEEPNFILPAPEGMPDARDIELVIDDRVAFSEATSIEAYPDWGDIDDGEVVGQDGIQEQSSPEGGEPVFPDAESICETDSDLDAALSSDLRTSGTIEGQTTNPGDPLINLQDVKPGDFGEVTLSFHVCGNPGYVWLTGSDIEEGEGAVTEPELDDPEEDDTGDGTSDGELAENIQTRVWYDDGDNIFERETSPVCLDLVLDHSGSIEEEFASTGDDVLDKERARNEIATQIVEGVDTLDGSDDGDLAPSEVSVDYYRESQAYRRLVSSSDESEIVNAIEDLGPPNGPSGDGVDDEDLDAGGNENYSAAGSTNISAALENALTSIEDCPEEARPFVVFFSNDGVRPLGASARSDVLAAAQDLKDAGATVKLVLLDVEPGSQEANFAEQIATGSGGSADVYYIRQNGGETVDDVRNEIQNVADDIQNQLGVASPVGPGSAVSGTEEVIFEGTLDELGDAINFDPGAGDFGIPLDGDLRTPFDELNDDPDDPDRECYENSTTQYIGLEWWLPIDHGNQVQGDYARFDLGFYTEQCRHNDGSGQPPE